MSYYPAPGCRIRKEVKIELDLSNYLTIKELDHARGFHTYDLGPKKSLCFES